MTGHIIKGLKVALCAIIAWEMRDNPQSVYIVYICLLIIGIIITRKIYERS